MASLQKLERSISLNDLDASSKVREHIQQDVVTIDDETKHSFLKSSSECSFVLQSFQQFSVDFKKFIYSFLVAFGVLDDLIECGRLNWCDKVYPMVPMITIGDGNCLMHAASIAMWAVNDRYHTLRKMVYNALLEDINGFYHKRWQRELEVNNLTRHGYEMTEEQWSEEWRIVLDLISQNEFPLGSNGMRYSSLEEIHIFVLANVLRRTIIIVSNDVQKGNYDEPLTPLNFPGIYLPLNWDPVDCVKTPLVIGYSNGHFSAIVSFEDGIFDRGEVTSTSRGKIHGVPLDHNGRSLPVHFLLEDEEEMSDGLLRQYLDCMKVDHEDVQGIGDVTTLVAKLSFKKHPGCMGRMINEFFESAQEAYKIMVQKKNASSTPQSFSLQMERCKTENCEFFGTYETLYMCSKCLSEYLRSEQEASPLPKKPHMQHQKQQLRIDEEQLKRELIGATTENQHLQQLQLPKQHIKPEAGQHKWQQHQKLQEQLHKQRRNRVVSMETKHCANRVNGCEFFGIPQQEGFCSNCYDKFCSSMRSISIEKMKEPRTLIKQGKKQEIPCQTSGCTRPGCSELYDKCAECYGESIKNFIHNQQGQSLRAISGSNHRPENKTRCIVPGCPNIGQKTLRAYCGSCYQTRPPLEPANQALPQGLKSPENSSTNSLLYCSEPMCGHPLGETPGTSCATCIMGKFHLEEEIPPSEPRHDTKRKEEILRARNRLEPLYIPTRDKQGVPRPPENVPMATELPGSGLIGATAAPVSGGPASLAHCLTPNCPFYANPENQFLCDICHDNEKKQWELINNMSQRKRQEPRRIVLRDCVMGNCYNKGSPGNDLGLCDKCFQTAMRNERVWDSEARRHHPVAKPLPQRLQQTPASPKKTIHKTANFVNAGMPCNTKGCLKFATENNQGYCDKCYQKQRKSNLSPRPQLYETKPEPKGRDESGNSAEVHPSHFTGSSPSTDIGVEKSERHLNALQNEHASREASMRRGDSIPCIQEGCSLVGSTELAGLCLFCYEGYMKQTTDSRSGTDSLSEQHQSFPHSVNSEPVSTSFTTLNLTSPRTCAVPGCDNQVQPSGMNQCGECIIKLYPTYSRTNGVV